MWGWRWLGLSDEFSDFRESEELTVMWMCRWIIVQTGTKVRKWPKVLVNV